MNINISKLVRPSQKLILVTIITLLIQSIFLPVLTLAMSDGEPPIVERIEINQTEVTPGEKVDIEADVSDDISGVRSVAVMYDSPSKNNNEYIGLDFNSSTGFWEGTYSVKETDEEGIWTLSSVYVIDNAGNSKFYREADLNKNLDFTVTNPKGDGKPPVVEHIEINQTEVTLGEKIDIEADVSDDISGVKSVAVMYDSPSKNNTEYIGLDFNSSTGFWEGTYSVKETDEEGIWTLSSVYVIDNAGNSKFYRGADLNKNLDFTVANPKGDGEPPIVERIEINQTEVTLGEKIDIEADVSDDISGVKSVAVMYDSPSKNNTEYIGLDFNSSTGFWEGTYSVKETDEEGIWALSSVYVIDNAGNSKFYREADLNKNLDFTVLPPIDSGIEPLTTTTTITNQTWSEKTIEGNLYVGPNSVLTINGNVTIEGDVFVYGAIRNYGDLTINGTLNARQINWGYSSVLYNGTVLMLGGTNSINTMSVSNQPWEVPTQFYNEEFIVSEGTLELTGATLPIVDLFIHGKKINLNADGTFKVDIEGISNNQIIYETNDVFGHKTTNYQEVIQYKGPTWGDNSELSIDEKNENSVSLSWPEATDWYGINAYQLYQDGDLIFTGDGTVSKFNVSDLEPATTYDFKVVAVGETGIKSLDLNVSVSTDLTEEMVIDQAVKAAEQAINALPNETELVLEDRQVVETSRELVKAVIQLGSEESAVANISKLVDLETRIVELEELKETLDGAIQEAEDAIDALPNVEGVIIADKERIQNTRDLVGIAQILGATSTDFGNITKLLALEIKVDSLVEEKEALESAIQMAIDAINALPPAEKISLNDHVDIQEARLTIDASILLGASETEISNISKLISLEGIIEQLELEKAVKEAKEAAIKVIGELPEIAQIMPSHKAAVSKARETVEDAYEAGVNKSDISNISKLTYIETRLELLAELQVEVSDKHVKFVPNIIDNVATIDDTVFNLIKNDGFIYFDLSEYTAGKVHVKLTMDQINLLKQKNVAIEVDHKDAGMVIPSANLKANKETIFEMKRIEQVVDLDKALSSIYSFKIFQEGNLLSAFESEPVTLTFKVDQSKVDDPKNVQIYYFNKVNEAWELIGGNFEYGFVSVTVDHFSTYAAFDLEGMQSESTKDAADQEGSVTDENVNSDESELEQENDTDEKEQGLTNESEVEEETSNQKAEKDEDNKTEIPNTATSMYNWLFMGLLLLIIGGTSILVIRSRT